MTEKDGASNSKGIFEMTETEGDIFAEPENAILLRESVASHKVCILIAVLRCCELPRYVGFWHRSCI